MLQPKVPGRSQFFSRQKLPVIDQSKFMDRQWGLESYILKVKPKEQFQLILIATGRGIVSAGRNKTELKKTGYSGTGGQYAPGKFIIRETGPKVST